MVFISLICLLVSAMLLPLAVARGDGFGFALGIIGVAFNAYPVVLKLLQ